MKGMRFTWHLAVIVFPLLMAGRPMAADKLACYRIRFDQENYFSLSDGKVTAYWDTWGDRELITSIRTRSLPKISKVDGTVTVTVKAAASLSEVYLLCTLTYEHRAPTTTSLEIPVDGLSIAIGRDSLTAASPTSTHFRFFLYLTPEEGNAIDCEARYNGSTCTLACDRMCAEVLMVDSVTKMVEVVIHYEDFLYKPVENGALRAIEIRYHTEAADGEDVYKIGTFVTGDTIISGDRLFVGNLGFDEHFFDPVYVITSPTAQISLRAGGQHTITWGTTVQGGVVGLNFSGDGGATWKQLAGATPNDGSYPWTIPGLCSDSCLLRLKSDTVILAESPVFSITCDSVSVEYLGRGMFHPDQSGTRTGVFYRGAVGITWYVSAPGEGILQLITPTGKVVASRDCRFPGPGRYTLTFDNGHQIVADGIYFARFRCGADDQAVPLVITH